MSGLFPPVPMPIHPPSWSRPAGNVEFKETRDLATHRRVTPLGLGCDFGNEREGANVYAMAAGRVVQRYIQNTPGQVGHGALILRIDHGNGASSGYAHLKAFSVNLGTVVARGQKIGVVGSTGYGISGPHLHADYQRPEGTFHEILTLLDEGDDMTTIVDSVLFLGADGKPAPRTISFAPGTYWAYRLDGTKKSVAIPTASSAPANATCTITHVPDADPHGPGWLRIVAGAFTGFYVRKGTGITVAPDPVPPPGGGYSQQDLDDAYNAGRGAVLGAAAAVPPR